MFAIENMLNDIKFCFFGWSLRIHSTPLRWKITNWQDKNWGVWLWKNGKTVLKSTFQFCENMTSLSLLLQQSTIEVMGECLIKNSRQWKSSELPGTSHLKIRWHKCIFKGKGSTDVMSLLLFKSWQSLKIDIGNQYTFMSEMRRFQVYCQFAEIFIRGSAFRLV